MTSERRRARAARHESQDQETRETFNVRADGTPRKTVKERFAEMMRDPDIRKQLLDASPRWQA